MAKKNKKYKYRLDSLTGVLVVVCYTLASAVLQLFTSIGECNGIQKKTYELFFLLLLKNVLLKFTNKILFLISTYKLAAAKLQQGSKMAVY